MTTTPSIPADVSADEDIHTILDELAAKAAAASPADGPPAPMLAGTFALYPDNGALVLVMDIREGAMPQGVHRGRIPSGMIRAVGILAGGGGKLAALRALASGGKRAKG